MSLLDVIYSNLNSGTYTVNRYTARTYGSNGKLAAPSAPTPITITASIQPVTGRDLDVLIEAAQTSDGSKVYTDTPLLTRRPGQEPDEILIDGEVWVVYTSKRWQGLGVTFYEALIARKGQS